MVLRGRLLICVFCNVTRLRRPRAIKREVPFVQPSFPQHISFTSPVTVPSRRKVGHTFNLGSCSARVLLGGAAELTAVHAAEPLSTAEPSGRGLSIHPDNALIQGTRASPSTPPAPGAASPSTGAGCGQHSTPGTTLGTRSLSLRDQ